MLINYLCDFTKFKKLTKSYFSQFKVMELVPSSRTFSEGIPQNHSFIHEYCNKWQIHLLHIIKVLDPQIESPPQLLTCAHLPLNKILNNIRHYLLCIPVKH